MSSVHPTPTSPSRSPIRSSQREFDYPPPLQTKPADAEIRYASRMNSTGYMVTGSLLAILDAQKLTKLDARQPWLKESFRKYDEGLEAHTQTNFNDFIVVFGINKGKRLVECANSREHLVALSYDKYLRNKHPHFYTALDKYLASEATGPRDNPLAQDLQHVWRDGASVPFLQSILGSGSTGLALKLGYSHSGLGRIVMDGTPIALLDFTR
ncbi:hypothetical protein FA15DRAFT_656811 [Coprinopsis marcescibilis]|uniref:Uncharacterized protein n=1 Tax=Coprinopsis marcescibilis TaxID=230819 RepID=A0A5C3L512_COPMA|nr:hypothetical protein FA15DRAFT_656811 [Coprinopsis marcescibilis]